MRRRSTNLSRDARPNAKTPPGVLHDLDNIVRDYLIPGIEPALGTVAIPTKPPAYNGIMPPRIPG